MLACGGADGRLADGAFLSFDQQWDTPIDSPTRQSFALFVRADDGGVVGRLQAVVDRGLRATVFAGSHDPRTERIAAAADAELGAIWPDSHRPVVLCPKGLRSMGAVDRTCVVPGETVDTWVVIHPDGSRHPAINCADVELLDAAISSNAHLGPVHPPAGPPPADLSGCHSIHIVSAPTTLAHSRLPAIVAAVRSAGATADVRAVEDTTTRRARMREGSALVRSAAKENPSVLYIHDPELLPATWRASRRGRCTMVYDVHDDLRAATRHRIWIPRLIRRPFARLAGRIENILAARLAAVTTDSPRTAITFASRGANAISVADPASESAKLIALFARLTRPSD